ncbi:MAG: hypothetical protein AB1758_18525 [Candidatus Eremiobacterota bacterium]
MDPLRSLPASPAPRTPQRTDSPEASLPGDRFAPAEGLAVRSGRASPESSQLAQLIHPLTALEFRATLEGALQWLPGRFVAAVASHGYRLHVVDSRGGHPLTLEPVEVDPASVELVECCWDGPRALRELAVERGAPDVEEFSQRVLRSNPSLPALSGFPAESPVPAGLPILVPAVYWWQGRAIVPEAWEFLTRPARSAVAGLVLHGPATGFREESPRIVLWDTVFRRGDGLADWYVLHEMGHTADFCYAFRRPEAWRVWKARLEQAFQAGTYLTRYSGDSPGEYFAEGFAAWATPSGHRRVPDPGYPPEPLAVQRYQADRAALAATDPELEALILEAVAAVCS